MIDPVGFLNKDTGMDLSNLMNGYIAFCYLHYGYLAEAIRAWKKLPVSLKRASINKNIANAFGILSGVDPFV